MAQQGLSNRQRPFNQIKIPRNTHLRRRTNFSQGGNNKCSNMQCQLRIVARIRPLNTQERDQNSHLCVRTVFEKPQDEAISQSNQEQLVSKASAQRRNTTTRSSPPRLTPASQNTDIIPTRRQSFLSQNKIKFARGNKSDVTSLVAGTENLERFDFDAVLGPEATQKDVYNRAIRNAVRLNTSQGINTTIIGIGDDMSGKNYTMSGGWNATDANRDEKSTNNENDDDSKMLNLSDQDGIIPRAINDLFMATHHLSSSGQVTVTMSFYEVSEEGFRDLLENKSIPEIGTRNLSKIQVDSPANIKAIFDSVSKRHTTNTTTGRCHQFCSFQTSYKASLLSNKVTNAVHIVSQLTFVNLAGPGLPDWLDVGGPYNQKLDDILRAYTSSDVEGVGTPLPDNVISNKIGDTLKGPCVAILVACVSPANGTIESTLDVLRLTQITRNEDTSIMTGEEIHSKAPSLEEFKLIAEENKVLKQQIETLSKGKAESSDGTKINQIAIEDGSLTNLQQQMRQVEEAAQKAKESSQSFAAAADRWRSHRKQLAKAAKAINSVDITMKDDLLNVGQLESSRGIEEKVAGLEEQNETTNQLNWNQKFVQALQGHVNHLAKTCKAEEEKTSRIKQEYEELSKKFTAMEAEHSTQTDKLKDMENELLEMKRLLMDERLLTEQLEKLRESSKRHANLQNKKIVLLTEKLEKALAEKADVKNKSEGSRFILTGERRLREQVEEMQMELELNYLNLSSDFNLLKLEKENTMHSHPKSEEFVASTCSKEDSKIVNLLEVLNGSFEKVFRDFEDEKSENEIESPQPLNLEDSVEPTTEDLFNNDQDAARLFMWADKAVPKAEISMSSSSAMGLTSITDPVSTKGVDVRDDNVISNMDDVTSLVSSSCQTAGFSVQSTQHTEFFLPNLSSSAPYERDNKNSIDGDDASIYNLKNILRPWQCDFLSSLGIYTTKEFVRIHKKDQHRHSLAKKMRRWRRQQNLPAVKTRSCAIALLIWARTCKAVDRFFLKQMEAGNAIPKRPDFLEVGPSASMSSLGFGSSIVDPKNQMEM